MEPSSEETKSLYVFSRDNAISVGAVPVGLDQAKVARALWVLVRLKDGPICWLNDGSDPSVGEGFPGYDGDMFWLPKIQAQQLRMVREGVTNGICQAFYYRSK